MKPITTALLLLSILFTLLTAYMIYADKPFWGWTLFAVLFLAKGAYQSYFNE